MCLVLRNYSGLFSGLPSSQLSLLKFSISPTLPSYLPVLTLAITTALYFRLFPGLGHTGLLVALHLTVAKGQILWSRGKAENKLCAQTLSPLHCHPPCPQKRSKQISSSYPISFPSSRDLPLTFDAFVVCLLACRIFMFLNSLHY